MDFLLFFRRIPKNFQAFNTLQDIQCYCGEFLKNICKAFSGFFKDLQGYIHRFLRIQGFLGFQFLIFDHFLFLKDHGDMFVDI